MEEKLKIEPSRNTDLSRRLSVSSIFFIYAFALLFIVVFDLSFKEFLVFFLVDTAALIVVSSFETRLFTWFHPDTAAYFPKFRPENLSGSSVDKRVAFFESIIYLPAQRALYAALVSYFKVIPAALIAIFYWHHDISALAQLLKFFAVTSVVFAYYYGAVFIDTHVLVSNQIAHLHEQADWSEAFRRVRLTDYKADFDLQERMVLISITIFMLTTQWMVITTRATSDFGRLAIETTVVGLVALLALAYIWYRSRSYFVGGLISLFNRLQNFDPEKFESLLPLHSSPLLARFEMTFNALIDKARVYKKELSHWMFVQNEESRFRALGEISAMVVHDLSGPLHVINFCSEQLYQDPDHIRDPRYLAQLRENSARAQELIHSLKRYLKNPVKAGKTVFGEGLQHVMRLLEIQFALSNFNKIEIRADPQLDPIVVELVEMDLIHVLLNLLTNSFENLLANGIENGLIDISVFEKKTEQITIRISDNGTGLSAKRFEELTGSGPNSSILEQTRGLGLKLVRRIVEAQGGSLCAIDPVPPSGGATLLLTLGTASGD